MPALYLEHDGRVLIVERDGRIELPTASEVTIEYDEVARRRLMDQDVIFAQAKLDKHPDQWPIKDELASDPACAPIVHAAVNASLFRPVVGVVVRHGDDVLLVRPARGVAEGHWVLPGGFLGAFETPEEGARREVREETGLELDELRLAASTTYGHPGSPYPILGLAFIATTSATELTLPPDEIAEARWVPLSEAAATRSSGFTSRVLAWLREEGHV